MCGVFCRMVEQEEREGKGGMRISVGEGLGVGKRVVREVV